MTLDSYRPHVAGIVTPVDSVKESVKRNENDAD